MTAAESTEPIGPTVPSMGLRSRQGGTLDPSRLVGRARELEALGAAIADARSGRAGRVLLVGEPGIGKSALLDAAVAEAPDARVARVTGLETEEELAFGALLALVRPFVDRLDRLPGSQRAALESALELGRAEPSSRFAVSAATLALVAVVAEEGPLVLVLDDVQWIDAASLSAMSFAFARLEADAVAVLAAARPGGAKLLAGARFDVLQVDPLAAAAAAELLDGLALVLDPEVRRQLVTAAHGNPLALIELTAGLTEGQRSGKEPLPDQLPAGEALERAFAAGVSRLPPPTRAALLVAALGAEANPGELESALSSADASWLDLGPAEEAGLISLRGGTVAFRHPLVRAAVVGAAGAAELRRAHASLADALPAGELRARHRAAAALGLDADVAHELDEAARAALARGGPATAVSLWARAAELSADPREMARRRLAAAEAAWLAGQTPLARSLCERVLETAPDRSWRARALHLRGQVAHQTEAAARARELLLEAAALADDLERREVVAILADAVGSCIYAGDARGTLKVAERLSEAATVDGGAEEFLSSLQLGTALFLNGRGDEGEPLVRRAIELVRRVDVLRDEPRHLGLVAMAPGWVDEPDLGRELADRAVARARELRALNSLPTSLKFRAWADFDLGHWDAALAAASEAVEIAREIGQTSQLCANLGIVAAVLAGRGDEQGCTAAVDEALLLADELGLEWHRSGLLGWRGLLELGLGKPTAAATLEAAVAVLDRLGNRNAGEHPRIDLVEALLRAGRIAEARALLDAYEAMARRDGLPYGLGSASRLRGLLAPDGEYAAPFERALELLEREVFPRARTHLCFGERLRRSGERRRARAELETALELFERLGAEPWAERCRQELVASGRRLRRIHASNRNELTPQELQVALQVACGLTNREIAQALFLSPKTVEFHLTRIYRKLGLHARAELVERYADQVRGEP